MNFDLNFIQVKYVHAFVIAFNGESPRMTFSLKSMIRLFEKMFGNAFWSNAIFEVKITLAFLVKHMMAVLLNR